MTEIYRAERITHENFNYLRSRMSILMCTNGQRFDEQAFLELLADPGVIVYGVFDEGAAHRVLVGFGVARHGTYFGRGTVAIEQMVISVRTHRDRVVRYLTEQLMRHSRVVQFVA